MLEIVLTKDGSLKYRAPHVSHEVQDASAVSIPSKTFSSITMYTPIYSEKGPSGVLRTYEGSSAYADLLNTYGRPDVRRYGLPYSMAVTQSRLGGAVTVQSLKSEGATHGSVIITMGLDYDTGLKKTVGYYNTHKLAKIKGTNKVVLYPNFNDLMNTGVSMAEQFFEPINGAKPVTGSDDPASVLMKEFAEYYYEYVWGISNETRSKAVKGNEDALNAIKNSIPEVKNIFVEADGNGENKNRIPRFSPTKDQVKRHIKTKWVANNTPVGDTETSLPEGHKLSDGRYLHKLTERKKLLVDNVQFSNVNEWSNFEWLDTNLVDEISAEAATKMNLEIYNLALDELQSSLDKFVEYLDSLWKPVKIPALRVTFKTRKVDDLIKEAKQDSLNSDDVNAGVTEKNGVLQYRTLASLSGVTSWDALEYIVKAMGNSLSAGKKSGSGKNNVVRDYNGIITQLTSDIRNGRNVGVGIKYETPIIWGICNGKGKYGNNFLINFSNIKDSVDGRPVMEAYLMDTRSESLIPESRKVVSINNDYLTGGVPVLLDSAYSLPQFEGDFKFATASHDTFDSIGSILESFIKTTVIRIPSPNGKKVYSFNDDFRPVLEDGTSYGLEGDLFIKKLLDTSKMFEDSDDSNYHRLQYLDLTRVYELPFVINSSGIQAHTFNGGHEGELQFMKEFDWNFNFNDPKLNNKYGINSSADAETIEKFEFYKRKHGGKKIVEEMFINAFSAAKNQEIRSLYANGADYIIDAGYPISVKNAIINLCDERDEIQFVLNTSINNTTIDQSIREKNSLIQKDSRNAFYVAGSFEWLDDESQRSVRVPASFAMLPIIYNHYASGYSQPLVGIGKGDVTNVQPYSLRGVGSLTLVEKDKLYENGINIFSARSNGRVYLDSQLMNYHTGKEISSLQEFHNNSIINRIIKDCYLYLQQYKHILSNDSSAEFVQEKVNENIMAKYKDKVASLSYTCKFNSTYDKAIGLLSHSIDIQFNNSIKYHHVTIKALPIT